MVGDMTLFQTPPRKTSGMPARHFFVRRRPAARCHSVAALSSSSVKSCGSIGLTLSSATTEASDGGGTVGRFQLAGETGSGRSDEAMVRRERNDRCHVGDDKETGGGGFETDHRVYERISIHLHLRTSLFVGVWS